MLSLGADQVHESFGCSASRTQVILQITVLAFQDIKEELDTLVGMDHGSEVLVESQVGKDLQTVLLLLVQVLNAAL